MFRLAYVGIRLRLNANPTLATSASTFGPVNLVVQPLEQVCI